MPPHQVESLLLTITLQLIFIILSARVVGSLFRFLGQPQVCGEIAAGLLLGPSAFGALFPHAQRAIFDPSASNHINVLSQIGLIFVMFLVGLEFDFAHLRGSSRTALGISSAGIILPFGLGLGLGLWIHAQMKLPVSLWAFSLFTATALSITAMPVLGRIMIEFNLTRTRLGALTISAAAMDDAAGWLLLALVSAIAAAQLHPLRLTLATLEVAAYLLLMIFVARPILVKWVRRVFPEPGRELSLNALAQLLAFVLISAAITNRIGIFSVFGAFVIGGILYDQTEFRAAVNQRMRDLVTVFFLPIFFTYTGLRTDITSMNSGLAWMICALVVLAASIGKFGGCAAAAKLSGLSWREASLVGVLMNARGLMELIVLNAGYDLGVIPKQVFFIFVIMALATTYMTAPVLRRIIPGTDVQPSFELSQFVQQRSQRIYKKARA